MVPYEFSNIIENKAKEKNMPVTKWTVNGGAHAFIVIGLNKTTYKQYVTNFLNSLPATQTQANQNQNNANNNNNSNNSSNQTNNEQSSQVPEKVEEEGFFDKIGQAVGEFFISIFNFFKGIFS